MAWKKSALYRVFGALVLVVLLVVEPYSFAGAQESNPVVVLQPGHGQLADDGAKVDPGATYNGLIEKDINLEVAKRAQDFLERCSVSVYLTRSSDDKEHELYQVAGIVQSHSPAIAIAIHTNSGAQSGTEGWYTEGGFDDSNSKSLAAILAEKTSVQMGIKNLGTIPDSKSRFGRLYIRDWQVPSALIEIGYLQKDYNLLKDKQKDFGRAIAWAVLQYLDIPPTCADNAIQQQIYASTYFPDDNDSNTIQVLNDGVIPWNIGDYALKGISNTYGAEDSYRLLHKTMPGAVAEWKVPLKAPASPNVYQQQWQVYRSEEGIGKKINVYIIVVPQQAKELKENIDKKIQELKNQGQQAIDDFIEDLKKQAVEWAKRSLYDVFCKPIIGFLLVSLAISTKKLRKRA